MFVSPQSTQKILRIVNANMECYIKDCMNVDEFLVELDRLTESLEQITKDLTIQEEEIDTQLKTLTIVYKNYRSMLTGWKSLDARVQALEERDNWRSNLSRK